MISEGGRLLGTKERHLLYPISPLGNLGVTGRNVILKHSNTKGLAPFRYMHLFLLLTLLQKEIFKIAMHDL